MCIMLPASGQDGKILEPQWRLALASFALATTSGLITFLLDYCSSVPGLPTTQPSPTLPRKALSSPHILFPHVYA